MTNSTRAELDQLGLTALRAMVAVEPYGSSDPGGDPSDDEPLMKLKWPQIFGVSLSLELGKAATDLKPCTQCGHWPMLGMSIPCASKYRFRPESGPPQQNIALQDRHSSFMHSVCCTLFHAT